MRLNNCLLAAAVGVALALPSIDAADATPVNDTFSVTATLSARRNDGARHVLL